MNLTPNAAEALLDGGIDATAALDSSLQRMLQHLPDEDHAAAKEAIGLAMAGVLQATVDVALRAYPALQPDREAWLRIARECAGRRAG
ncbi:hypothetical protein [Pseudomonas sp. NPDC089406]|uniref:hypothetical protein n=1 Tax=Pseudomonas sp. NPDC089406 TaxID=3364463 RepID=UPI00384B6B80